MSEKLTVKVGTDLNSYELDEYVRDHELTPEDFLFEGRKGKHFIFSFYDRQKMMMFKLRFSG